jgi:RNA polymerase sigma-70 factor (ECF subfamily)
LSTKQRHKPVATEPRHKGEGAGEYEFVRAFVLKLVGDPSLADDLVQETFLRAHKSGEGFKGGASRTTWLCAIALNITRDHFRATARRPKQVSDPEVLLALRSDEALEDNLLQREMDLCIRRYVLRLPERQRDVVALHDIAGLTHREVSSALGISQSNSRILLHRGRAALKLLLEENCELCFDDSTPCQPKAGRTG